MEQRVAKRFLIGGTVQGVGYRYWTEKVAQELRLGGWVRNLPDGRVEIFAEGDPEHLEALEARAWRGPRAAQVTEVVVEPQAPVGTTTFAIRRDA